MRALKRITVWVMVSVVSMFALLLVAGIAWHFVMPYPFGVWMYCKTHIEYRGEWSLSPQDSQAVMRLIKKEMGFLEIVECFYVKGIDEVHVRTIEHYDGPLAARGRSYVLKKVNGEWEIIERGGWMS